MNKKLSEITRAEWISTQWLEITSMGDDEKVFSDGYKRTPDEAAQAAEDWDATADERSGVAETEDMQ